MTDLRVLLAFAALCALALLFIERGIRPAFAPFCAVGGVVLWLAVWGALGLLAPGAGLAYLVAAGAAGWVLWRVKSKKSTLPKLGFGFWFFVASGLCVLLLLWLKQPMFTTWDEFSFWGTAGKLMKLYGQLYTTAPMGWIWPVSQVPALPGIAYFFQFFGRPFAEWQSYAGVDVFMLAAMAAVLAPVEGKKQWSAALPMSLILLLTPYAFFHYMQVGKVSPVYMDVMADIPMGLAFAAVLCCWFGGDKKGLPALAPVCVALATLTLVKDIALFLALVACALIFCDCLFARTQDAPGLKKRLGGGLARLCIALGSVFLAFSSWEFYTGSLTGVNRLQAGGGKLNVGLLALPGLFVKDLLAPEKSAFFTEVMAGMRTQFLHSKNTMLGSGAVVTGGILLLVTLAALLTQNKRHRRRCICFGLFSTLGFAAYYLLITLSYLYILRAEQAFESYERYIFPYTIAWLLCALALFGKTAAGEAGWRGALGKLALLALSAAMLLRVGLLVPAQYTLLGVNPAEFGERRAYARRVQELTGKLDEGDRVFYVNTADTGIGWFMLSYEMLPAQLDYSFGGGALLERTSRPDGTVEVRPLTREEFEDYLLETGCTKLFIEYAEEYSEPSGADSFYLRYGSVFSDGMQDYFSGAANLYEVRPVAGGVEIRPLERVWQ